MKKILLVMILLTATHADVDLLCKGLYGEYILNMAKYQAEPSEKTGIVATKTIKRLLDSDCLNSQKHNVMTKEYERYKRAYQKPWIDRFIELLKELL